MQPFERGAGVEPGEGRDHLCALPRRQHRCDRGEGAVGHLAERLVAATGRQGEPVAQQPCEKPLQRMASDSKLLEHGRNGDKGNQGLHDVHGHGAGSRRNSHDRCLADHRPPSCQRLPRTRCLLAVFRWSLGLGELLAAAMDRPPDRVHARPVTDQWPGRTPESLKEGR
jgi:hypothetical protein